MHCFFEFFGVIVFALTGIQRARDKQMNPCGIVLLATVTALGGGTVRDLLLTIQPLFWIVDPSYLMVILATCICGSLLLKLLRPLPNWTLPVQDAVSLALFVNIGVDKALLNGNGLLIAVLSGIITGIMGGIVRDMLAGEKPLFLYTERYATACLMGGLVHALLRLYPIVGSPQYAMLTGIMVTLAIRLADIRWPLPSPFSDFPNIK